MPSAPHIVWLRNDLRLDDHAPLLAAVASGAPVLPVYCIDPWIAGQEAGSSNERITTQNVEPVLSSMLSSKHSR